MMKPKIRFRSTMYGLKYVCEYGGFSGVGDSMESAYADWMEQYWAGRAFAKELLTEGMPTPYKNYAYFHGRTDYQIKADRNDIALSIVESLLSGVKK